MQSTATNQIGCRFANSSCVTTLGWELQAILNLPIATVSLLTGRMRTLLPHRVVLTMKVKTQKIQKHTRRENVHRNHLEQGLPSDNLPLTLAVIIMYPSDQTLKSDLVKIKTLQ